MIKFIIVSLFIIILIYCKSLPSVGVVYITKSKLVLRIIIPDKNEELYEQSLMENESILIFPILPFGDTYSCGKRIDVYACKRLVAEIL